MDITELKAIIDANIFENTSQAITGDALNDVLNLIADSLGEYVPAADIFDEAGTIRSALLPSYVDDVLEFSTRDAFPAVGEGGKIYLATDTNLSYRWGGSEYVIIAQSLALGETSSTAYRGDRGKIAYDHSQTSHRLSIAGLEVSALGGSIEADALASALSIPELRNAVAVHIGDGSIHITADERAVWNKIASLFGIDDSGDIYIKNDENGKPRGFYTNSFISAGGKSDTEGTGSGTVTGIKIGDDDIIPPVNGILNIPPYPTTTSLGLKALAFKDALSTNDIPTLDISKISGLQSALDGKQAVISDLATIREGARLGAIAHSWDNHAKAGYALASNLTAHTGNSTIHITAAERTSWNNKYDKPASGIPKSDLAQDVQTSLGFADSAYEGLSVVSAALQSLQSQIDSVSNRNNFDEINASAVFADNLSARRVLTGEFIQIGNATISWDTKYGCLKVDKGLYSTDFLSAAGFSDTPGTGGGTVVGANIDGVEVPLLDGILAFPPYPTAKSLGLGNIAFKNSLVIADVANLQSTLDEIRTLADEGHTANEGLTVVSVTLQSLQAQIDSLANKNHFDELIASVLSADIVTAQRAYIGTIYGALDGNAATATKLSDNTAFTAWGQTFFENGKPKNVSGALTGATTIEASTSIKIGNATISWDTKYGCLKVDKGLYSTDFLSAAGKSDTQGSGGGTVVGATVGEVEVKLIDGVLKFDAYPTITSLGLKNLAFKDSLSVSEVVGLQSELNGKQNVISDLATIMVHADEGHTAYGYFSNGKLPYSSVSGTPDLSDMATKTWVNMQGYLTGITSSMVVSALGYTPYNASNPNGYISGISKAMVENVLIGNITSHTHSVLVNDSGNQRSRFLFHTSSGMKEEVGNMDADGAWGQPANSQDSVYGNAYIARLKWSDYYYADIFTGPNNAGTTYGLQWRQIVNRKADNWRILLDTANFNTYTPTLTGGGASGTWGINISGNAATATNADTLDGFHESSFSRHVTGVTFNYNTTKYYKLGNLPQSSSSTYDAFLIQGEIGGFQSYRKAVLNVSVGRRDGVIFCGYTQGLWQRNLGIDIGVNNAGEIVLIATVSYVTWTLDLHTIQGTISYTGTPFTPTDTNFVLLSDSNNVSKSLADGTVEKATKLATSRTIWGQSFNGTANVSGDMTGVGSITASGNILASGAITAGTASDSRLKSNIATLCNASSVLRQLRGVGFDWNALATDKSSYFKGHDVGLIAQEVEPFIPSAIGTIWGEYKRLDYTKITPYLVEGWKAHDDEIHILKAKINKLEERISALER